MYILILSLAFILVWQGTQKIIQYKAQEREILKRINSRPKAYKSK